MPTDAAGSVEERARSLLHALFHSLMLQRQSEAEETLAAALREAAREGAREERKRVLSLCAATYTEELQLRSGPISLWAVERHEYAGRVLAALEAALRALPDTEEGPSG